MAGAGVEESTCAAAQTLSSGTTSPVNSAGSFSLQQQQQKHAKMDLWKNAFLVDVPNHPNVKIQWFELKIFTIYAREGACGRSRPTGMDGSGIVFV